MRVSAVIWGSLCLIGVGALRGPSEVTVPYGEELSVTCHYNGGYKPHEKYWCRGAHWKTCEIIAKSSDEKSKHRYSIEDNPSSLNFTVTGRGMRPEDSDTYHCGIERNGIDEMHAVKVTVLPGNVLFSVCWVFLLQ
ncbi:CMRF35-like molecule 7 [Lithobates pipiens]